MPVPFAMRWEVSSYLHDLGSFVETARVHRLGGEAGPALWVQRLVPGLGEEHRARVLRRWYLATRLTSTVWPRLIDAGEDEGRPWVVLEASGFRLDGALPFVQPLQAVREVRRLAAGLAEAEALFEARYTRAALSLRPNVISRTQAGEVLLHLAALDQEPDEGFPYSRDLALFTPEQLLGHPASARTNVFCLGWLLCLALTGRWPYAVEVAPDLPLESVRAALAPHILAGRLRPFGLPESLRPVEVLLRRSLAPQPPARLASAAAFADALQPLAPGLGAGRSRAQAFPFPEPPWNAGDELLPAELEGALALRPDDPQVWEDLALRLDGVLGGRSRRAALIRAQPAPLPGAVQEAALLPSLATDRLECTWQRGYVRALAVAPAERRAEPEAHVAAVMGLLQHPSLRFLQEVQVLGPPAHARVWVEALQRQPLPALRQVALQSVAASDAWALDLAYRLPQWSWTFGGRPAKGLSGLMRRLIGSS